MAFAEGDLAAALSETKPRLLANSAVAGRTRAVLHALSGLLDAEGRLDSGGLQSLLGTTQPTGASQRQHRRFVGSVLDGLNQTGRVCALVPAVPVTVPRPAALPVSVRQGAQLAGVEAIDHRLEAWLERHPGDLEVHLLALALRLVTRLGLGEPVAVTYLARLDITGLTRAAPLELPISPDAGAHEVYRLQPPRGVADVRARLGKHARAREIHDPLTGVHGGQPPTETPARCRAIREALGGAYARFLQTDGPDHESVPGTWRAFAHVARYMPLRRGLPPALIALLRDFPLPASSEAPWWDSSRPAARVPLGTLPPLPDAGAAGAHAEPATPGAPPAPPVDAHKHALQLRRSLLRRMHDLYEGPQRHVQGRREHLRAHLDACLQAADARHGTRTSVAHAALEWAFHLKVNTAAKRSTIDTYLSRVLNTTLLSLEESQDLLDWDEETLDEVLAEIHAQQNWGERTQQHFHNTFVQFLSFCAETEYLPAIRLPASDQEIRHRARRTDLLNPFDADRLVAALVDEPGRGRHDRLTAAVLVLGFYAGLRASEVMALTLRDIFAGDGEIFIYVQRGKTAAARRKLPLHALAPAQACRVVTDWVAERRAEAFPARAFPGEVALFGPCDETTPFRRDAVIDPLIAWLMDVLRMPMDFHALRHSAASWMLLRMHAARYPDVRARIAVSYHQTFDSENLEEFRQILCGPEGETGERRGVDLVQIAKLIGHRDVGTLLVHYAHVFSVLHSDLLQRAWHQGKSRIKRR